MRSLAMPFRYVPARARTSRRALTTKQRLPIDPKPAATPPGEQFRKRSLIYLETKLWPKKALLSASTEAITAAYGASHLRACRREASTQDEYWGTVTKFKGEDVLIRPVMFHGEPSVAALKPLFVEMASLGDRLVKWSVMKKKGNVFYFIVIENSGGLSACIDVSTTGSLNS